MARRKTLEVVLPGRERTWSGFRCDRRDEEMKFIVLWGKCESRAGIIGRLRWRSYSNTNKISMIRRGPDALEGDPLVDLMRSVLKHVLEIERAGTNDPRAALYQTAGGRGGAAAAIAALVAVILLDHDNHVSRSPRTRMSRVGQHGGHE